eukprot:m51a1_g5583 putative 3 5 -cyclic nucleotide phosphodiesterase (752) ;mRNA; f:631674-635705
MAGYSGIGLSLVLLLLACGAGASREEINAAASTVARVVGSPLALPFLSAALRRGQETSQTGITSVEFLATSPDVIVDSMLTNTAQAGVTELSPVDSLETCSYLESCGALVSVPILASPIAMVFNNASGLPLNLRISRTALSGIMTGNIGLWNHPTLVADNPALAAVGALPITVVWTRDRNRAAAIEAATSKLGVPGRASWTRGRTASGTGVTATDSEVVALVGQTAGAVALADRSVALVAGAPLACLQNSQGSFVCPTTEATIAAINHVTWTLGFTDANNAPGAESYPLISVIHFVLPTRVHKMRREVSLLLRERSSMAEQMSQLENKLQFLCSDVDTLLNTPAELVIKMLKEIKAKTTPLTPADTDNIDRIVVLISQNKLYQASGLGNGSKMDKEITDYIKDLVHVQSDRRKSAMDLSTMYSMDEQMDELDGEFAVFEKWEFNPYEEEPPETRGFLSSMALRALKKEGLLGGSLHIDYQKLLLWLHQIEKGYNDNPYHNSRHAADVLQCMCWLMHKYPNNPFNSRERLAAIIACVAHDFKHPGLTANYLVNTVDPLAIRYNCESVLESMHASDSMELLMQSDYNFLDSLPRKDFVEIYRNVVRLVLATDMAKHVEILGSFNAKVAGTGVNSEAADKLIVLVMMMKVADLSNAARPWTTCKMWADRICTEFFNQGDQERKLGLAISPFMDRNTANLPKMQCTFGDVIVKPTLESMQSVIPAVTDLLDHMRVNKSYWQSMSLSKTRSDSSKV